MWLIRCSINYSKWQSDEVIRASDDLVLNPGLSVFRAISDEEISQIVVKYQLLCKSSSPDKATYLRIPESIIREFDLSVEFCPDPELPEYLRVRHYEIHGLENQLGAFISRIIATANCVVPLTKSQLIELSKSIYAAMSEAERESIKNPNWYKKLSE